MGRPSDSDQRTAVTGDIASDATMMPGSDSATTADLPAGFVVGEYVIEALIGRGGFGTVYRATHPLIGKRVAIKVLARKYSADHEMVSRFIAEARAVNQIRHRHIIDIFSFGELSGGRHYYVMEHLDGEPLDQYLAARGALRLDEALPILRSIARALDAAHAKGIAHRDLKPENIFLATDDDGGVFPKLLDFGIAKLTAPEEQLAHRTATGVPIGTPYYMSPEQCRGRDVDHRTDIYSFGVLAYRVLTGTYPFEGELVEILHKQMHEEPSPPSTRNPALTPDVDLAIAAMMHKDAAGRPATVLAAVSALGGGPAVTPASISALGSQPRGVPASGVSANHVLFVTPPAPIRPGRSLVFPVVAGVLVIAGALTFFVVSRGTRATPAHDAGVALAVVHDVAVVPDAVTLAAPAAPVDAAPANVIVTVTGTPEGTEVFSGKVFIGSAPGGVMVPRSTDPTILTFKAAGYLSVSRQIAPDKNQDLALPGFKEQPGVGPAEPKRDDIPAVFGRSQ